MKPISIKFNKIAYQNGLHSETVWVADEVADAINSGKYIAKYEENGKIVGIYNTYIDPKADSIVTKAAAAVFDLAMNLGYKEDENDLSEAEKEIMQLSNKLYDLLHVHPDYWQPNPTDNPEMFFEDGDLNPTFKDVIEGEDTPIVSSNTDNQAYYDICYDALLLLIKDHNLKNKQIREALQCQDNYVSLLKKGKRRIDFLKISKIAHYIGLRAILTANKISFQ